MKPGEVLIWQLFEMVRELMPANEANTRRLHEWAQAFHALEHGVPVPPEHEAAAAAPGEHELDDDDDEPAPHRPPRKKR